MTGLVVGEVFANAARAVPDRTAIVLGERSLTFAEVDAAAELALRRLYALGIAAGDRVALTPASTGPGIAAVPVFAALARLGAVLVTGDAEAPDRYRPALVLTGADDAAALIADLDDEDPDDLPEPPDVEPAETDPCLIAPSGRRGVLLSHRALVLRSHPGALAETRGTHVFAADLDDAESWTLALGQWHARDTLVLVPGGDPAALCTAVREHAAARLTAAPEVWRALAESAADAEALDTLRFADTGPTEVAVLDGIARVAPNATVRIVHGSPETGVLTTLAGPEVFAQPGACGIPGTLQYIALDPDGEMCVRGPLLFDGYADDAAATADALTEGWYRTGDLAVLDDASGALTVTGRAAELIRVGADSVGPGEVERVLKTHPGVRDVVVIGLPHPDLGRVLAAVLVAEDPDRVPGPAALRKTCESAALAPHKHPTRVFYATELPTGPNRRTTLTQEITNT
ncbi:class I adenylate-forming enzyme family protein [Embleya sp. NBC_00896]|uniref:class I adenylate-forming enzyme family protein n=1 Tax=Embleya sp. NBC_00896 TaxID=2975961 RepID=UPI00386EA708|nr:long-chain fatty acid--CoA ligase [Embleya sp. NBC_00896]